MFNPISAHRQEVSDRILKGFDADTIEKAPQFTPKSRRLRTSKNGTLWWDYRDHKGKKLIEGDDITIQGGKHITKNSDMLLKYTEQMKTELKDIIDSAEGFELTRDDKDWKQSATTPSQYLRFNKDGVRFAVRISDHTKATENNATVYAVNLETQRKRKKNGTYKEIETWVIDASLGNITPKNIGNVVSRISKLWSKYNTDAGFEKLRKFAEEHNIKPITSEDVELMELDLAEKFINANKIKDNGLCIAFQVLRAASRKVLESMLDEDDD